MKTVDIVRNDSTANITTHATEDQLKTLCGKRLATHMLQIPGGYFITCGTCRKKVKIL